jgi:hypothetical protein
VDGRRVRIGRQRIEQGIPLAAGGVVVVEAEDRSAARELA